MRSRLSTITGERWFLFLLSLAIATAMWFSVREGTRQVVLPGRPGTVLRTVPVIPTLVGAPAEGFAVRGVDVRPPVVLLTGPEGILKEIDAVYTAEVDIFGARSDLTRTVDLRLPPVLGSIGAVTVSVRIGPATSRWVVPGVRVVLQGLPDGLRAEAKPAEIAVEVDGAPNLAAGLRAADLRAVVDAAALAPGTHRVQPQVQVPAGVRVVSRRPAEVEVAVRRLYP